MARRRSARLASGSKAVSQPTTAPNLESVVEHDESPVNDPAQSLDAVMSSPVPSRPPQTPSVASKIKPPMSEMHPSKVHPTMAAPSSALRLGFTDIKPKDTSNSGVGAIQSTPSKSHTASPPFNYQFARDANVSETYLGPEAQRMMNEIREEAAKIKADLIAKRDQDREKDEEVNARKIARPKGKAGRYSAVHMAEFKKMDSIANHPSAFRAAPGRFTPTSITKQGIKRTQSKANLADTETVQIKTPAKATSSKASKKAQTPGKDSSFPAKRSRQQLDDDASTNRPVSREGSNIPRPKTPGKDSRGIPRAKTFAHLLSPTQASLARATDAKSPSAPRSILKSTSKLSLAGIKKSTTASSLAQMDIDTEEAQSRVQSPGRFDKVKSIFAKHNPTASSSSKPGIPKPTVGFSKTPAPVRTQKELPPAPFTTPGKKTLQHGNFTPAPKHAALAQNSPSPVKTGIPRSKTNNALVQYPSLDSVLEGAAGDVVSYPDLSNARALPEVSSESTLASETDEESCEKPPEQPIEVPGTFTFRSDHTIHFGSSSPKGFGGHSGQSSVRHVRHSILPPIPGAFPSADMSKTAGPRGKENLAPHLEQTFNAKAFPHGVSTKRRHRVEDDDEEADREAAERAAKKMKGASVPEGEALMAPRLASAQKGTGFRSPSKMMKKSPFKSRIPAAAVLSGSSKKPAISMSRLAYLAQPKQRK